MTPAKILEQVAEIVADTIGLDTLILTPATTAADVEGWDSLANVQIFVALDKRFGIRFRTGEMAPIRKVGELVKRIEGRINVLRTE